MNPEVISTSYLNGLIRSFFQRRASSITEILSLYTRRTSRWLDVSLILGYVTILFEVEFQVANLLSRLRPAVTTAVYILKRQ